MAFQVVNYKAMAKKGVKPISFHQQGKSKTSLESPLINWVGGIGHNNWNDLLCN
jgi:hypothetical protein